MTMYDGIIDEIDEIDDNDDEEEEDTFGHNVWWCVQDITPCHPPASHLPPTSSLSSSINSTFSITIIIITVIITINISTSPPSSHPNYNDIIINRHHSHDHINIWYGHNMMEIILTPYSLSSYHHVDWKIQPYGWKASCENCTLRAGLRKQFCCDLTQW